jgi:hypothetical protein
MTEAEMPFVPRGEPGSATPPVDSCSVLSLEQAREQWGYQSFQALLLRPSLDPVLGSDWGMESSSPSPI